MCVCTTCRQRGAPSVDHEDHAPQRFTIELVALPAERYAGVPADVRLRQLLKVALRRLGLKCAGVRQAGGANPAISDGETTLSAATTTGKVQGK